MNEEIIIQDIPNEVKKCSICGISTTLDICPDCREKSIGLKISFKVKIFILFLVCLFGYSIKNFSDTISEYKVYVEAEEHYANKEYSFAYYDYYSLFVKHDTNYELLFKTAESAFIAQYFDQVAEIVDGYLLDVELEEEYYAKATKYYETLEPYYKSAELIDGIMNNLTSDDYEANLEKLMTELKMLLEDDSFDKTLVYFYLGGFSTDVNESINYFKKAVENNKYFTYPLSYYGNSLRYVGRMEEAREIYDLALLSNRTDALAIRGLSILDLLDDKKEEALRRIMYAHELEPYDSFIGEALIIALYENNLPTEAESALKNLQKDGFEIDESFQGYLDKDISLEEYYVGGVE